MDPRLVVVGLVVGLLVGLTGVGGSSILTPLLILMLGVKPLVAVGTDLAYSVPTKLLGALIHRRQGTVDWRVVGLLCVGGLPASLAGLGILALLRARLGLDALNAALKHGVGALLLIVAVVIVLSPWLRRRPASRFSPTMVAALPAPLSGLVNDRATTSPLGPPRSPRPACTATRLGVPRRFAPDGVSRGPRRSQWRRLCCALRVSVDNKSRALEPLWTRGTRGTRGGVIALGALVGVLVSLTSIGAGSITVPVLYLLLPRLGLRRVVGSDVAFAALLIPTVALGHLGMGDVNLGLSLNLLVGSLPGVFIGSKLCARLPDTWLRPAMAGALLFAGTRLV